MTQTAPGANVLRLKRLGIDTHHEAVVYMRADCEVCRSEGFEALAQVKVSLGPRSIIATVNMVRGDILALDEAGLSESAWKALGAAEGELVAVSHPEPLVSLAHIRRKVYGHALNDREMLEVIEDVAGERLSDVALSAFVTACAGDGLTEHEVVALTRAMIAAGERLEWGSRDVVDKHCVGGLPGNRTTLIVVPIVAAFGLTIPKTSSRAITSPAGTADTMEVLAPVDLSITEMRHVVHLEGGCIAWGGAVKLSPADDILIRIERALDIDTEGQLVASVLSKKTAAGSSHVVIDIPVGPTAKVRTREAAQQLATLLGRVGRQVGLTVTIEVTDGTQPVGQGIGPALEARDVMQVLRNEPDAPADLRERALLLAGRVLEFSAKVPRGMGVGLARTILEDGRALRKFEAICEAQGGMRLPPSAAHTWEMTAEFPGTVGQIDNRKLARIAKLAGAPHDKAAGVDFLAPIGTKVEAGQPLFRVHAESPGELEYALGYLKSAGDIIRIDER